MKRPLPLDDQIALISSDDSSSDSDVKDRGGPEIQAAERAVDDIIKKQPTVVKFWEDSIVRRAAMYQDYMKQIPIPTQRGSAIPCNSWVGLGRSVKDLYAQPLHYLTNVQLREWDQARLGTEDEHKPLDEIIHPIKAEVTIWLIEETHRQTASYFHIAKHWKEDSVYHKYVDPIFPLLPWS